MYADIPALDARIVEIPYNNSDVSMLVILPNNCTGLSDLETKLATFNYINLNGTLTEHKIQVSLPIFTIETELHLDQTLQSVIFSIKQWPIVR